MAPTMGGRAAASSRYRRCASLSNSAARSSRYQSSPSLGAAFTTSAIAWSYWSIALSIARASVAVKHAFEVDRGGQEEAEAAQAR